ncbi:hypothetical protein [Pseudorhodobacter sp.]|uniref:hypothetical protein n=1 Tax=Pseudorhodobacter sp. TaxID=1934400 RepID=UPI0026478ECC|nr:hypothetical protein [Pseudorhodobacter sp.]MDN5786973.1 hypothetical protein [Pseudorhodobacter sp.]
MPFILGLLGLLAAAYFWVNRAKNAAHMTNELAGVASDVMAAARRFGFSRKLNLHPVESIDDPKLAATALGLAFLELDGLPTAEQHASLTRSVQSHLDLGHDKAQEALILGRWLLSESGGAAPGFTRILRRLFKLQGRDALTPLMAVLNDTAQSGHTGLSVKQKEALEEVTQTFRLR